MRLQRRKRASNAAGETRSHLAFAEAAPAGNCPPPPSAQRHPQKLPQCCTARLRSAPATVDRRPSMVLSAARASTWPSALCAGRSLVARRCNRGQRWVGAPRGPASEPNTCLPAARWPPRRAASSFWNRCWPWSRLIRQISRAQSTAFHASESKSLYYLPLNFRPKICESSEARCHVPQTTKQVRLDPIRRVNTARACLCASRFRDTLCKG